MLRLCPHTECSLCYSFRLFDAVWVPTVEVRTIGIIQTPRLRLRARTYLVRSNPHA
jgi:hypothetical protein